MKHVNTAILMFSAVLVVLPANAADYTIDTTPSVLQFSVSNMGVNRVKGKFKKWSGTVTYDAQNATKSQVRVAIESTSINTGNEKRDHHLRGADFFEVEKYPQLTFESQSITQEPGRFVMTGPLSMHGVTKPVTIYFTILPPDAAKPQELRASGKVILNRRDFQLTYGNAFTIGNEVTITMEIIARPQTK